MELPATAMLQTYQVRHDLIAGSHRRVSNNLQSDLSRRGLQNTDVTIARQLTNLLDAVQAGSYQRVAVNQ